MQSRPASSRRVAEFVESAVTIAAISSPTIIVCVWSHEVTTLFPYREGVTAPVSVRKPSYAYGIARRWLLRIVDIL